MERDGINILFFFEKQLSPSWGVRNKQWDREKSSELKKKLDNYVISICSDDKQKVINLLLWNKKQFQSLNF